VEVDQVDDMEGAVRVQVGKGDPHPALVMAADSALGLEIHGAGRAAQLDLDDAWGVDRQTVFGLQIQPLETDIGDIDPGLGALPLIITDQGPGFEDNPLGHSKGPSISGQSFAHGPRKEKRSRQTQKASQVAVSLINPDKVRGSAITKSITSLALATVSISSVTRFRT